MLTFIIIPRISEMGGGGHIGNAVLPVWFEEARLRFLDEATRLTPATGRLGWLVRHAAYDYEREVLYRGDVEIRSQVSRIGTTSLALQQEAWQNGERAVSATTTLVLFDLDAKSKVAASDATRRYLEALMK